MKTGFCLELADAVIAGDRNHPLLVAASWNDFSRGSYRENILRLPFVRENSDGTISMFEPCANGSYSDNVDRGRHHGALLCKFLRDTENGGLFGHMNDESPWRKDQSVAEEAYRVGLCSAIAQIAISGPRTATVHQSAMLGFYHEIEHNVPMLTTRIS